MGARDIWRRVAAMARAPFGLVAIVQAAAALTFLASSAAHAQDERVFTVGNYPVDARAQDAVAAKEKAISDGQQAAFRSLLKRIVPVTSYKALAQLKTVPAANLISGMSVRSERNSTTSYTASLDFTFDSRRVRDLLRQRGIPFLDEQARETAVVLVVQPVGQASAGGLTQAQWRDAWSALDLDNGLTPVRLYERPAALTADLVKAAMQNPEAPLRTIAVLGKSGQAILAIAEPDLAARRLHVTLSGVDGVGKLLLRRTWRMDPADAAYAAELAAVVAMGTMEGRWKAVRGRAAPPMPIAGAPLQQVHIMAEFRSFQEWQGMRRQLEEMPGVADVLIGGLSAGAASVALRYPGGGPALAAALGPVGLALQSGGGGTWVMRSN
jgi:hypothetical protein